MQGKPGSEESRYRAVVGERDGSLHLGDGSGEGTERQTHSTIKGRIGRTWWPLRCQQRGGVENPGWHVVSGIMDGKVFHQL